jgi:hypothetical protein
MTSSPTGADMTTNPLPYVEPRNGYGLTALITGICSIGLSLIPILWFLGGPLGIVAVGMGLANRGRLRRGTATNRKSTIWGIVLGAVGIIIAVIGFVIVQSAVNKLNHDLQQIPTDFPS